MAVGLVGASPDSGRCPESEGSKDPGAMTEHVSACSSPTWLLACPKPIPAIAQMAFGLLTHTMPMPCPPRKPTWRAPLLMPFSVRRRRCMDKAERLQRGAPSEPSGT
eukprot:5639594-Karenia_brevis.AAC.1